jgi:hypothetical protein
VLVLDPVLKTRTTAGFAAWPVAEVGDDEILVLSGRMTPLEVGTAMAVIFRYNDIPAAPVADLPEPLDRHLAEIGPLVAPGGLRLRDTAAGTEITPACCCGLESWREWGGLLRGEPVWLGHDPGTEMVHTPLRIRLTQQAADARRPTRRNKIEIPRDDLPDLLASAHLSLREFLRLVRRWADRTVPHAADRLVAVLDDCFEITGPLDLG